MNKQLRKTFLLANQELSILCDSCLDDIAFLLGYRFAFENKENYDDDDKLFDAVSSVQSVISPLIQSSVPHSESLQISLRSSDIIPEELIDDIDQVLTYKEESNRTSSIFLPESKDDIPELLDEMYRKILFILRTRFIIKDIEDGIEEYGLDAYLVHPEDRFQPMESPYDDIDTMPFDEVRKQMFHLLSFAVNDFEDEIDNQKSLTALCVAIEKIKGEN